MQNFRRWECIRSRCTADGAEGVTVYGVRLISADGVREWPDVDASAERVACLLERLQREQPEDCHLEDIIRDFIIEQSIG